MAWHGMAWIWAFLGWTEKDIDTGQGLILGLRVRLFSSLLFPLLGQLRLYDSFLAGQSGTFTLSRFFTSFHFLRNKDLHFTLLGLMSRDKHKHKHKHTYNSKRYTLPMQTSKKKKQHSRPNEGIQICHHQSRKSSLHNIHPPNKIY